MASLTHTMGLYPLTTDQTQQCLRLLVALVAVTLVHRAWKKYTRKQPPLVNPPKLFDFTGGSTKVDFLQRSYEIIHDDTSENSNRPYTLYSDVGPIVVLPPKFADEIKNNPSLNFMKNIEDVRPTLHSIMVTLANGLAGLSRHNARLPNLQCRLCRHSSCTSSKEATNQVPQYANLPHFIIPLGLPEFSFVDINITYLQIRLRSPSARRPLSLYRLSSATRQVRCACQMGYNHQGVLSLLIN